MLQRRAGWVVDAVVAAVCLTIEVGVLGGRFDEGSIDGWRMAAAWGAAIAAPVALLWRRRAPGAVLAIALAAGAVLWASGVAPVGHGPTVLVALYAVAAHRPRRESVRWAALTLGTVTIHQVVTWWVDGVSFAGNVVLLTGAWWLGDAARRRHLEAAAHHERAEQLAAARDELARHAVAEERLRIARELHDVVAHTMSAVAVQAGTGRVAFEREPDVARAALVEIEHLTRAALVEMRRLLHVLRSAPDTDGDVERVPVASLADLDRLVATSRTAGVDVEVHVDADLTALPPGVDLAAFRIIQEALTNVARHAATDRAVVSVRHTDDTIAVEIDDDGPTTGIPRDAPGGGMGIIGMRERAATCGGTLVAAPKPAGGFRVRATLPLRPATVAP